MNYLVTGAVGFIGSKVTELLLEGGHQVVGIDNFDDYYSPLLKTYRLEELNKRENFRFLRSDIENLAYLQKVVQDSNPFDAIIHLAARAGVRPSVANPTSYGVRSNDSTANGRSHRSFLKSLRPMGSC